MMPAFLHEALPARVLFGAGTLSELDAEAERLGIHRAMLLTTPQQRDLGDDLRARLGRRAIAHFDGARMHTPTDVTEDALRAVADGRCDGVIAIGGGSTTGLAKAVALRTDLPQIVVPTTYAGSEVTPILGETADGSKTTQRSLGILPETVIYDVDLTLDMPVALSITSGLNAIAHAAEALYAPALSPILAITAQEGVRALVSALPRLVEMPRDAAARSDALYGAWLCGTCLGLVGMALHHKLCHVLGGSFDLPHAETHSVILPHALAYNLPASNTARERLSRAIGASDPAAALHGLAVRLGAPTALRDLGMAERDIAQATRIAVTAPYPNPRPFDADSIEALIRRAWAGEPPIAG